MTNATEPPLCEILPEETDPDEIARFRARRERLDMNEKWFQTQVVELGKTLFGKYVGVAGREAFVADSAREALAAAAAAHPDDDGRFFYYFPTHRLPRV